MMNRMIVANLVYRPIRSVISIIAIALEVTLILLIVGLSLGILNDARARAAGIGADVIVQPPGSSFMAGCYGGPVCGEVGGSLRTVPRHTGGSPGIWDICWGGGLEVLSGVEMKCPAGFGVR